MGKYMLLLALPLAVFFAGCESDDGMANITFTMAPLSDGNPVDPGEVIQTNDGRNFYIDEVRFFMSDIYLLADNGARILVDDLVFLDWPGAGASFDAVVPKDDYYGLEFYVGLDAATNDATPTDYPAEHPLSAEQDMHWGMLKYRFLTVIGQVDISSAGDQIPANPLVYHLGRDELYSKVVVLRNLNITGVSVFFSIDFELANLFDGTEGTVDIATDRVNHSGEADMPNARIVMSNFVEALEN